MRHPSGSRSSRQSTLQALPSAGSRSASAFPAPDRVATRSTTARAVSPVTSIRSPAIRTTTQLPRKVLAATSCFTPGLSSPCPRNRSERPATASDTRRSSLARMASS